MERRNMDGQDVAFEDEDEVWRVWCEDCGFRAARLTYDHRRGFHL